MFKHSLRAKSALPANCFFHRGAARACLTLWRKAAFAPCVSLLLLCLALLTPALAQATPIGTVISLTPGVSALRGGQTIPLALKDIIEEGDTIVTDGTGKVQIIFDDDSTVTLANATSLDMREFRDEGDDPAFQGHIGQGLVRIITGKIVEQNPEGFSVSTPHATVGIRGTVLDVGVEEGRSSIFVENTMGKGVYVNDIQVQQGSMAIVDSPGAPPDIRPISPQEQQDLDESATVAARVQPAPVTTTANTGPGPNTALATENMPQQALVDDIGPQPAPPTPVPPTPVPPTPPTPPAPVIATVSGTLSPTGFSPMVDGGGVAWPDYAGSFSFSVNMSTGAITGATMQASSNRDANPMINLNPGLSYNLSGGSGTMNSGTFHIDNYVGPVTYPLETSTIIGNIPAGDPGTYMNGSGNISTVGGGVSGTFQVSGAAGTGWNADNGTFTGSRTN